MSVKLGWEQLWCVCVYRVKYLHPRIYSSTDNEDYNSHCSCHLDSFGSIKYKTQTGWESFTEYWDNIV